MNYLPISLIFFTLLASRQATKSWFSPGSFFAFIWLVFTISPIIFAPEYYINNYGLWYIALFTMSISSGGVLATFRKINKPSIFKRKIDKDVLVISLVVCNIIIIFGLIGLLYHISSTYKISNILASWSAIPNLISIDRYSGDLRYPILVKYPIYLIYAGNILSGILINYKKINFFKKFLCFLPLFFALGIGIIEGSRTSILLSIVLFASCWLGASINSNNGRLNISITSLFMRSASILAFFTTIFIYIQWLRQGLDPIIIEFIIIRIKSYFFGYLSAFSGWVANLDSVFLPSSFLTTLAGPFNLIGILERPGGFYLPVAISSNISTNIFTALRGFISDFSLFGSLMIGFILGYYFQLHFQKVKKHELDGVVLISMFYAFSLYSPLISLFHYNSIFFSWILVFLIIKISLK